MEEDSSAAKEGNTLEMDDNVPLNEKEREEETRKSPKPARQRKKRLLNQLKEQMEFYFSSANITKDRFMAGLISNGPFISLETFCTKFNKIRNITDDTNLLRKAVQKSSLLELSEDGLKVKRKEEVIRKSNETECTIYVENVPAQADHDWVRQIFSQYGVIDYISLPRYKLSCRPKGFAFVEFQTPEMADLALESFGAEKCRIPSDIDPSELQSIKTFEGNGGQCNAEGEKTSEAIGQAEIKETGNEMQENPSKKRKLEESVEGEEPAQKAVESGEGGLIENSKEVSAEEEESTTEKKSKKKKRKRSKKVKGDELESIYLKVMSKREWKVLRNKYLDMQRENMRTLKRKVQESRSQRYSSYRNYNYEEPYIGEAEIEEQYTPDTFKTQEPGKDKITKPEFIQNAVIKISFEEPPQDPRKLRETIREGGGEGVAYVDASAVEKEVYVRFLSGEAAASYKKSGCWSRMEILSGSEEEEYWKCIHTCWTQRREKRNKRAGSGGSGFTNQERGREKLLQKAFRESQNTKSRQHIIFGD